MTDTAKKTLENAIRTVEAANFVVVDKPIGDQVIVSISRYYDFSIAGMVNVRIDLGNAGTVQLDNTILHSLRQYVGDCYNSAVETKKSMKARGATEAEVRVIHGLKVAETQRTVDNLNAGINYVAAMTTNAKVTQAMISAMVPHYQKLVAQPVDGERKDAAAKKAIKSFDTVTHALLFLADCKIKMDNIEGDKRTPESIVGTVESPGWFEAFQQAGILTVAANIAAQIEADKAKAAIAASTAIDLDAITS